MSILHNEWTQLKDVARSMYHDNSLARIVLGGVTVAGVMELVSELRMGDIQENVIQMGLQGLLGELLRRMASRSDPQHLANQSALNPLGFRPMA